MMSLPRLLSLVALVAIALPALPAAPAAAASAAVPAGQLVPVTAATDPAWLASARAAYPLNACAVSGDAFDGGKMGQPKDYIYQQAGQPDRLVRLCCNDCVKDFKADPAKALAVIDQAAAAKK